MSPEKVGERGSEHMESLRWAIDVVLNKEAVVEVKKTESGRYKSLSVFRIDPETGQKKELLVYFDNADREIGPLEQELWRLGVEPNYIVEPFTEIELKQKNTGQTQNIKRGDRSQESIDRWNTENKKMLTVLFRLLKEGAVRLRIRHKKDQDSWNAEIYFIDSGNVWYRTDLPDDVISLTNVILSNGYEPEFVEE